MWASFFRKKGLHRDSQWKQEYENHLIFGASRLFSISRQVAFMEEVVAEFHRTRKVYIPGMYLKGATEPETSSRNDLKREAHFSPTSSLHKRQSLSFKSHDSSVNEYLIHSQINSTSPISASEGLHSSSSLSSVLVLKRSISTVSEEDAADLIEEAAQTLSLHASNERRSSIISDRNIDSCNEIYEASTSVFSSSSWTQYVMYTSPNESAVITDDVMQWNYFDVPTPGINCAMSWENDESLFLDSQACDSTNRNDSTDYDVIAQWNDLASNAKTFSSSSLTSSQSTYDQSEDNYYHVEMVMQPAELEHKSFEAQPSSNEEDSE